MIDLHVHSTASDGTLSPAQVAETAVSHNLTAIALTDHDTIDGIPEIMSCKAASSIEIIPGIELSCYYENREIHILGLFADYQDPDFIQRLEELKEARKNRNLRMIQLMQADGIPVTYKKLLHGSPNSVITRAHFARVLVEEGVCKDKEQAFRKYIGVGCKYYLPKERVTCEMAMEILKNYCKIPVLAHPLIYKLGYRKIEELLEYLKPLGLYGMECYHSSNNSYESKILREMAERHGLLISGGSDFHGANKSDIQIGKGRGGLAIPERLLTEMKEFIKKRDAV